VFGGNFDLYALKSDTGELIWKRDLLKEFDGEEIRWSNAAAPLVIGDRVLVAGGGKGQSYVAFRADNGQVLWKSGSDRPTHSTPVVATIHGKPQALFMSHRGLVSLDPENGKDYKAKVELLDAGDKLGLSGCIAFICRQQIWEK